MKKLFKIIFAFCIVVGSSVLFNGKINAQAQSGTTLSAYKIATGSWTTTYSWTIDKTVTPDNWKLFRGDSGTSEYTVSVVKDGGVNAIGVSGQVCVTNGGGVATENLAILDEVQYKVGAGQFQTLTTSNLDLSAHPVLAPSESYCYPYTLNITPIDGATYRNVAHVAIANHSGWLPGGQNCPGPSVCQFGPDPKADFSLPNSPTLINDSINVDDTNGSSWNFSQSGSVDYTKTFVCDEDNGLHTNTATIRETGLSGSAEVNVDCFDPVVSKTAETFLKRNYHWSITKIGDTTSLTLAKNEAYPVNYMVTPSVTSSDSDWMVTGEIFVENTAPIPAVINSVTDIMTGSITGEVDCDVSFPYTIAPHATLNCTYEATLPNANTRINTATSVRQNYAYDEDGNVTPTGTTSYSGQATVDFANATVSDYDLCANVTDDKHGPLGMVCANQSFLPFSYVHNVGPYQSCGPQVFINTATIDPNDSHITQNASWTVNINVPCVLGCTLTQGYWKNHAGFGPQQDMVTALLPKCLGNGILGICLPLTKGRNVTNAQDAVDYLGMKKYGTPANGITKLYSQLLAAKLNVSNGANPSAIQTVLTNTDNFLTNKNYLDWSSLTKIQQNQVLSWMTTFDNYNNGLIGPGHCDSR